MKKISLFLILAIANTFAYSQSLPITFSNPKDNNFVGQGGDVFSASTDPNNAANPVGKIVGGNDKYNSRIDLNLDTYVDMTTANKTITFRFYSTQAVAMNGLFQFNNEKAGGKAIEKTFTTNGAIGWQTITLDYATATNAYPDAGLPVVFGQYAGLSLFTNFGDTGSSTYYVDDIMGAANGAAVPTTTVPPPSPTATTVGPILAINYAPNATVNDTGTPSTATAFNPGYNFGGFTSIKNLATTGTNNAIFMNLQTGYGAGVQPTAPVNVSSYTYINFDYYVPADEMPGANGDEFYFDLISANPTKENNYEIKPSGGDAVLVKGSWQTVSVLISKFIAKGFDPTQFFQFKLGATSNINTSAVYFDNIYFSTVPATLGVKDIQNVENKLQVYPNPVNSGENVMISGNVKSVEIYNMNGQLVKTSASQSVSSQGLNSGVYLVKAIDSKGSVSTTKLIVK
jgi:hypothetical protein